MLRPLLFFIINFGCFADFADLAGRPLRAPNEMSISDWRINWHKTIFGPPPFVRWLHRERCGRNAINNNKQINRRWPNYPTKALFLMVAPNAPMYFSRKSIYFTISADEEKTKFVWTDRLLCHHYCYCYCSPAQCCMRARLNKRSKSLFKWNEWIEWMKNA